MLKLCLLLIQQASWDDFVVNAVVDFTAEEAARTVKARMRDPYYAHLLAYPMDKTGKHPLRKLGPQSLACSGCRMIADRFRFNLARKMRGKWKAEKKRDIFVSNLDDVCASAGFPEHMAILMHDVKGHVYIDYEDWPARGGGILSLSAVGPEVTADVVLACRHLVEIEFKEALLEAFLSSDEDGRDIDFLSLLCGNRGADVCD